MPTLNGQDEALESLIAAHQWKDAFKRCEKSLKKAKDSDYLQAKKVWILSNWPDQARKEQGFKELDVLLQRTPPVTDIETLMFLDNFENPNRSPCEPLGGDLGINLTRIWSKAVASRPQDEELVAQWYHTKFAMGDMEGARQASSVWQKNFPKNRKPFFLWILTVYLLSESTDTSEMMKKVHGGVAYKNISKAINYTIEDKPDTDTAQRDIRTLEDITFLTRIYRSQGRNQEAIIKLRVATNWKLKAVPNSWSFSMHLMELFEWAQQWQELHNYSYRLLSESVQAAQNSSELDSSQQGKQGDDWKLWQAFLKANEMMDDRSKSKTTNELLEILAIETRNARLAMLSYNATEVSAGRKTANELKSAFCGYFHDFSTKFICFQDLKRYLPFLPREQQEELLMFASNHARQLKADFGGLDSKRIQWITSEINALKLEYNLVVCKNKNENWKNLFVAFISNCLRLYRVSLLFDLRLPKTDRRPGDDAAILAAMGLVRLYKLKQMGHNNALLRAILVLEILLMHSPHNYDALLILVRLYIFYGAGSLAMWRYSLLSIKNMQHASLSWILYTRISTIHPYASSVTNRDSKVVVTFDPWQDAKQAYAWHANGRDLSLRVIRNMEEHGQWNMILDTLELAKVLDSSFSKYILAAEIKRIHRFRGTSQDTSDGPFRIFPQTSDTRDRSPFPSFECGPHTFEANLPVAGTSVAVNDKWLWSEFLLTRLWDMLNNDGFSSIREAELNDLKDRCEILPDSCTQGERAINPVVLLLYDLYGFHNPKRRTKPPPNDTGNYIKEILERLEKWLTLTVEDMETKMKTCDNASAKLTEDLRIPHWSYYHTRYTYLELCKLVTATLNYVLTENRKQAENQKKESQPFAPLYLMEQKISKILNECKKITTMIHRSAGELRERLRGPTTLPKFRQAVVGRVDDAEDSIGFELEKFNIAEAMTRVCKDIQGSWVEGLEGIIRTV